MKLKNIMLLFATIFIARSEEISQDIHIYNKKTSFNNSYNRLPMSTQVCVGDSCMASFVTSKKKRLNLVSIQVGAFRRYEGAKIYAHRYGILSNRYKTVIKNGFKSNRPIYRVQIEGFSNEDEANAFIEKYPILYDSFLVSR